MYGPKEHAASLMGDAVDFFKEAVSKKSARSALTAFRYATGAMFMSEMADEGDIRHEQIARYANKAFALYRKLSKC